MSPQNILDYTPTFIIRNVSAVGQKIMTRFKLQPGQEIDLLAEKVSEYDIMLNLLTESDLAKQIKTGTIHVVHHNLFMENLQKEARATHISTQSPLKWEDGMLSIDFASESEAGILKPADYGKLASTTTTTKIWTAVHLDKGHGPTITLPTKNASIITTYPESAIIRSKKNMSRSPRRNPFSTPTSIVFVTATELHLNDRLPEDATLYMLVTVRNKDAGALAINPPPHCDSRNAHTLMLTSENAAFITSTTENATVKNLNVANIRLPPPKSTGQGITLLGDGTMSLQSFPHTSDSPPISPTNAQLWFKTPENKLAFWCEMSSCWFWCDRKHITFTSINKSITSEGLPHRTAENECTIKNIWIEAQETVTITIVVNGKAIKNIECVGAAQQNVNLEMKAGDKIKISEEQPSTFPFIARLTIAMKAY